MHLLCGGPQASAASQVFDRAAVGVEVGGEPGQGVAVLCGPLDSDAALASLDGMGEALPALLAQAAGAEAAVAALLRPTSAA